MSDQTPYPPPPEEPSQPGYQQGYGSGYQPAPPPMPPPSGTERAGLGVRLLARLVDYIILGIVLYLVDRLIIGSMFNTNGSSVMAYGSTYAAIALSSVISAAVYLGYFSLMESRNGQTLGKMMLKLQTRGPGGGTPTMQESVRRNLWTAASVLAIIPFIGGLLGGLAQLVAVISIMVTIANSPTKQGWHDQFAGGTEVVRLA